MGDFSSSNYGRHYNLRFQVDSHVNGVVWLLLGHKKYRLYITRPAEHINRLDAVNMIPLFKEHCGVSGKGSGITGNIDDLGRRNAADGLNHRRIQTLSRRIHNNHIGPGCLMNQLRKQGFRCTCVKIGIKNMICFSIFSGILHCLGNDFDSDDLSAVLSQTKGNGTRSAVHIISCFFRRQISKLNSQRIQLFSLGNVDLEEGSR